MSKTIQTPISDINQIRRLMERSRYFIGLSGLSGVAAGVSALLGVALVISYQWAATAEPAFVSEKFLWTPDHPWGLAPLPFLLLTAAGVFLTALGGAYYFTQRRVRKLGYAIQDPKTYKLTYNLAVPLIAGGIFCLALLYHGQGEMIAPTTLIFYGLALLNASNFVSESLRFLSYLEMALGLISLFFIGYGLAIWALGFGLFHIGYGIWMYRNYDSHE